MSASARGVGAGTAPNVWIVKNPNNQNCYAVGHGSKRPAVLSFVEKRHAVNFLKMDRQMKAKDEVLKRPYERVVVENIPLDTLKKNCAAGGLNVCVVMRDGHVEKVDTVPVEMDHVVFHLENTFKYY